MEEFYSRAIYCATFVLSQGPDIQVLQLHSLLSKSAHCPHSEKLRNPEMCQAILLTSLPKEENPK